MNRLIAALLLILAGTTAAFASGAQEAPRPFAEEELSTLTGVLKLGDTAPVLVSGGEEYLVMVPPFAVPDIELEDGQEITLEGYVHEGFGRFADEDEQVIRVTKAIIDGEEYEIDLGRGNAGMAQGMMGRGGPSRNMAPGDFRGQRNAYRQQ
jgi:hypothetical protein